MNDIIILGMLIAGPRHGYRLKQDAALFSGAGQLHNNTVYPLLKQYEERGWITKKEAAGERGQMRLLYALTRTGRRALMDKLNEFSGADVASGAAFRLRVGLFGLLRPAERERILAARDAHLLGRWERVAQIGESRDVGGWGGSALRFVMRELELERNWITELRTQGI